MINKVFTLKNILILGFILRLIFLLGGWKFIYFNNPFFTNDTGSYTDSFLNLWQKGIFSFDLENADAYYGRLPGYPFFWGIHYLIFGAKNVHFAVACTQSLLDVVSIYLVFSIVNKLFTTTSAIIAALIYATYPFVIVWTTISGTESYGCFLVLLFFYFLFCQSKSKWHPIIMGIMLAMCFYNREYYAVIAFSPIIFYFDTKNIKQFLLRSTIYSFSFFVLYAIWPIRNYVNHGRFILVKTATTGYDRYSMDIISMRTWVYCWTSESTPVLDKIAFSQDTNVVDKKLFKEKKDYQLFQSLLKKARTCGTGTHYWGKFEKYPKNKANCNDEIENGFNYLIKKYKSDFTFNYLTVTPLMNLNKLFFKNGVNDIYQSNTKKIILNLLFGYRSFLLLLGIIGVIYSFKSKTTWVMISYTFLLYFFICFIFRQLEMRYVLQADLILTCIMASVGLERIYKSLKIK